MEWENTEKSPYHGIVVSCIMLVVLPIIVTVLFNILFQKLENFNEDFNKSAAYAIGCGVGTLFHLICILNGLLKKPFNVVKERVSEFIEDFSISKKMAFRGWLDSVKHDGIVFWIYISIMVACFVIVIINIFNCYNAWLIIDSAK